MNAKQDGITVQCVSCKTRKLLPFAAAQALIDPPMCDRCGMPMVAVHAFVTQKTTR